MKKRWFISVLTVTAAILLSSCSNDSVNDGTEDVTKGTVLNEQTSAPEQTLGEGKPATAMREQGNALSINLSEIAEESDDTYNAWIKISTVYDPELSMYESDSIAAGAKGVVVDFTVSDMDIDEATLYWCYELNAGGATVSLWDDTSKAEKLTVKGDGSYRMVFDAQKAVGGTIDSVGSLQIVFPGVPENTTTKFTVTSAGYVDSSMEISDFQTK